MHITFTAQPGVTPERAARAYLNSLDATGIETSPYYSDCMATGTLSDGTVVNVYVTR